MSIPVKEMMEQAAREQAMGQPLAAATPSPASDSNATSNITVGAVSRRDAVKGLLSTGAFVLGASWLLPRAEAAPANLTYASWQPSVYLGLEPNGDVIIVAHRSEMGTGIRSALPMVVADELGADWKRVKVKQAIGDDRYGSQNTDGSCSIRDFYDMMRQAGATARTMLVKAAAAQWKVPEAECEATVHAVVHTKSKKQLGFAQLVKAASALPVPPAADLKLKDAAQFRYIGKGVPTIDNVDLTTGKGIFGQDIRRPGMLIAMIERPPVFGMTLKGFDDSQAKEVKGVVSIVTLPHFEGTHGFQQLGGVAVLANNTWAALQARKKLKIDWNNSPNGSYNSDTYKDDLRETSRRPQKAVRNTGDVEKGLATAAKVIEAEYYTPMLAHAPMEPPAALAEFKDGKLECWAATQNPQAVQDAVSAALKIKKEDVICNVTLLGGGFGRKSKPDYVVEAALLAKQTGKPVKVVWTREDDLRWDYYHAVAAMYMKAGVDASGKPVAWLQRSTFPTIGSTFNAANTYGQEFEMGMGWNDVLWQVPNFRAENGPAKNPVRIGWLRAVANIYHAFAVHSFTDELAAAAGADRVDYLLGLLGPDRREKIEPIGMKYWNNGQEQEKFPIETGRLRKVIEVAAEKSGWKSRKPTSGRALGIAAHRSFLSYIAAVADVEVDAKGQITVHRIDIAVDCGQVIHPDRVKAQFEGAAVFGTSIALLSEMTARNGRMMQSNFNGYQLARQSHAPRQVHVHIIPSDKPSTGAGEPGVPVIPPAICNAIFAATGKRVRELPLKNTKLA